MAKRSKPITGKIGQGCFPNFIQKISKLFNVVHCAAGPAAKLYPLSGQFYIKLSAAIRAVNF
ncbi:MAG: hypothetical protein RBT11_08555 [Desulfobacterales bacterium]|nr:hypothetical protein [Desulfobacterales bacterium]